MSELEQGGLEEVAKRWSDALVASCNVCMGENEVGLQLDPDLVRRFYDLTRAYFTSTYFRERGTGATDDESSTAEVWEPAFGSSMGLLGELFRYYEIDDAQRAY
jgi:hypothetical protein